MALGFRRPRSLGGWYCLIVGGLLVLIGLPLLGGGVWLIGLGGSWYYAATGAALVASGVLLALMRRWGVWTYLAIVAATALWAVWEVGLHPWHLMPRLLAPLVLLVPVAAALLPMRSRQGADGPTDGTTRTDRRGSAAAMSSVAGLVVICGALGVAVAQTGQPTPATGAPTSPPPAQDVPPGEWRHFGRTVDGQRFSPLEQITRANVDQLEVAWTFRTGDLIRPDEKEREATYTFEATPLMVGDTLFLCTPHNIVIALDADTGRQKWRFDPQVNPEGVGHFACRGVSYYENAAAQACPARILSPDINGRLWALDARSGRPCADFGERGFVNLLQNMGEVGPGYHYTTSPPAVIGDTFVIGGWVYDNQSVDEPSGVVRAFDARTGEFRWAWDVGRPGQHGQPPPGEAYTRSTPNAWSVFSADPANGLVYLPTGNIPPDFYGAHRPPETERVASSVVALDAATGAERWVFQTTHHDLWDFDVGSQPVVVDIPATQGVLPAILIPTKRGEIFMLNRLTGRPLAEVQERLVPQAPLAPGERLSRTQPYSVGMPSFSPGRIAEKDMWGATPLDQLWCRIQFRRYDYEGEFTPPTVRGTVTHPGSFGVIDWGSVSVDPQRSLMFVNASWMPYIDQLIPRARAEERGIRPAGAGRNEDAGGGGRGPPASTGLAAQAGTPFANHVRPFLSPLGFPCKGPPWGELAAVDLRTRTIAWRKPFGTTAGVAPFGIALPTGIFSLAGSAVTDAGLLFIGASVDNRIRAFDVESGRVLWEDELPAGGQAAPITYRSPRTGRQYVVIAAGGHSALKTPLGDHVVAYALPQGGAQR